jgi:3-deoxy-D-manno-octulosonate 8-phosphate phosphatase (KDO 8-P phosphatase)
MAKLNKKQKLTATLRKKFQKVRLLILDIDGVMTDGRVFWIQGQGWTRSFHVHDGYGIKRLLKAGIQVAIFSGSNTPDIQERIQLLNIPHAYLGNEDKMQSLEHLLRVTQIPASAMAYLADDLFDLPVLNAVGLPMTVPQALTEVHQQALYTTTLLGGSGAVREVADLLLEAQDL